MIKNKFITIIKIIYNYFEALYIKINPIFTYYRNGIYYNLDLREVIDFSIYKNGYWEKFTHRFINTYIKSNDIVIEVGANIGSHTLPIAYKIKPEGQIHAFETSKNAYLKLKNVSYIQ